MTAFTTELVGIGNAIVDVISNETDGFLETHGLPKGGMRLIEADEAVTLYEKMGPGIEASGGSAANTLAGFASLGGRGAYLGKVAQDQLGEVFAHDLRAAGVGYDVEPGADGLPTARCLIVVTPDAQRTMSTFLGISADFSMADLDAELIGGAATTYLEGYLFDKDEARQAFVHAAEIAHRNGRRVALTLSDTFCVERHLEAFRHLVDHHVDILFANDTEICALTGEDDFDAAAAAVRGRCEIACLTRGARGSVILTETRRHEIEAAPVTRVVDTTGAGDQYAAGVLFGLARGRDLGECGRLGSLAAGEVIGHTGARPNRSLAALVAAD